MELKVNDRLVFAATGGKAFDAGLPCVMFLHGASFDRTTWRLQTRYFAWHGYSVLALDLPGHGRSDGPPLDSIEAMADWCFDVMDAAGLKDAAIVGHSMGGIIALEAAARQPGRVRAISLIGSSYPIPVTDALLEPARNNEHVALDRMVAWGFGRSAQLGGNSSPGIWMTGGGLRVLEQSADNVLYADLNACNVYSGGEAAAAALECPTQFILGERDMMTPARKGQAFADTIKGAQVTFLAGAGHFMMDERPDETLDALKSFL